MKQSTKDGWEGKLHEAKGKVKDRVGEITNNPDLETEGQDEKLTGKVQKKSGRLKRYWRSKGTVRFLNPCDISQIAAQNPEFLHHGVQGSPWHPEPRCRIADHAASLPENA